LFYQAENPTLTEHESIMLAVPETIDYEQFNSIIDALVESIKEFKEEHVLEALKLLVPEYSSAKETVF
jgi:FlaA1/EpsC-like NDP-sugar epimerase